MKFLDGKLQLYNVDTKYVEELHNVDTEVFYNKKGYENKPYAGVIITVNGYKYFIPLTSAKSKHISWDLITSTNIIVYEEITKSEKTMHSVDNWICREVGEKTIHLLSVLEIKKMIPVPNGKYNKIDISPANPNYAVLDKEYRFLKPIQDKILNKASKIYNKQMETGFVINCCCNFKKLEEICDIYAK